MSADVVETAGEPSENGREPLVVLRPLRRFLDNHGLGDGDVEVEPIGNGHSNVTYLVRRGGDAMVLRRPPRGPLPPSTHDVLREARVMRAMRAAGVRVPDVLATCADPSLLGAPFYVTSLVDGHVITDAMPEALDVDGGRGRVGFELVDALAEIHAVDWKAVGLEGFGRPRGYLDRQLRRFATLWEVNATRSVPEIERTRDWLHSALPVSAGVTVVHGDFRLGNVMFAPMPPVRLVAVLDWEMATLGDPLADVGYLMANYARPDDESHPILELSGATRGPGFPDRDAMVARYEHVTGRSTANLPFYEILALWKAAIFLEGNWKRFLAGSTDDPWYASLGDGVPALARTMWARVLEAR